MFNRYLAGEELWQQRAQTELQRYQAWANQQTAQQQQAIQMYLGRGNLWNAERMTNLAGMREQNRVNEWWNDPNRWL